jgi:hypothetical protein
MQDDARNLYGKYRELVTDNADPHGLARLKWHVPGIFDECYEAWALPYVSYAGKVGDDRPVGLYLILPPGALVLVEFEAGNPSRPIWPGCFWAEDERFVTDVSPDDHPGVFKTLQFLLFTGIHRDWAIRPKLHHVSSDAQSCALRGHLPFRSGFERYAFSGHCFRLTACSRPPAGQLNRLMAEGATVVPALSSVRRPRSRESETWTMARADALGLRSGLEMRKPGVESSGT